MKPTIGRIVTITVSPMPGFRESQGAAEIFPAIITKVHMGQTGPAVEEPLFEVDLEVFSGSQWALQRVKYSEQPKEGHWSWPVRE